MAGTSPIFICVSDPTPGPRSACPNTLHDWPLPSGYVAAREVARSRLARGWASRKCPDCGLYGWVQGRPTPLGDTRVPAPAPLNLERVEQIEKMLGVTLMPWQREVTRRALEGETFDVSMSRGRKS